MNKLTDILRKVLYGSDALMGNSYVEGLEAAINQYISENLNKLNPPVWKHDNGKAYYMFEVEKLDKFLSGITAKGDKA